MKTHCLPLCRLVAMSSIRFAVFLLSAGLLLFACGDRSSTASSESSGEGEAFSPPSLFRDATAEVGLTFVHHIDLTGTFPIYEITGSGMAVFDANGDGRLDLLCLDSGSLEQGRADRLYLQDSGGRLQLREDAGFTPAFSTGCTVGDLDNDGDLDLYVGALGMDHIYLNDGTGRFRDVSSEMGLVDNGFTTSVALVDYDLDGFLDVFCCRYVSLRGRAPSCTGDQGGPDYCTPKSYPRITSQLFRNNGGRRLLDVSADAGIGSVKSHALGVMIDDFNDDGWPDIYVANDTDPNLMWINSQKGRFSNAALMTGTAVNRQGASEGSMGLAIRDVDGDGLRDIFTTNYVRESNTLYLASGGMQFKDGTIMAGLSVPSLPFTGWGTAFFDPDNDADLDLVVVNGAAARRASVQKGAARGSPWTYYAEKNLYFENSGEGRFRAAPDLAQDVCRWVANNRSLLAVDFDGDGGVDVLANAMSEGTKFFRNVAPRRGNWIKIDVLDSRYNRRAHGAVVRVYLPDRMEHSVVRAATSYQAALAAPLHFGLGEATGVERIEVRFPGEGWRSWPGAAAGQTLILKR